jgi:hypothetical protein
MFIVARVTSPGKANVALVSLPMSYRCLPDEAYALAVRLQRCIYAVRCYKLLTMTHHQQFCSATLGTYTVFVLRKIVRTNTYRCYQLVLFPVIRITIVFQHTRGDNDNTGGSYCYRNSTSLWNTYSIQYSSI